MPGPALLVSKARTRPPQYGRGAGRRQGRGWASYPGFRSGAEGALC